METVTTRIPENDEALLAELQEEMSADRSEVLRRLIHQGLSDWCRERALDAVRDHRVTIRKAADMAGLDYVQMLSLAAEEGIDVGYTLEDLERDVEQL